MPFIFFSAALTSSILGLVVQNVENEVAWDVLLELELTSSLKEEM